MGKEAKFVVRLSVDERKQLSELVARGRVAAAVRQRAQILLRADAGEGGPDWADQRIAELLDCGISTVHRVRQRFVTEGLDSAVRRKPAKNRLYRKLDGVQEAKLIALACSDPPAGRVSWTMQLLADKLVELEVVDTIGREAVRTTLKKTRFSLGAKNNGCCRPNKTPNLSVRWRTSWKSINGRTIRDGRWSVSMSRASN
jgi:transposase